MEKKRETAISVTLSEKDTLALLSILDVIAESDKSNDRKNGKTAAKIRDSIISYRRPCKMKTGKGYVLYFYEFEAAMLIKYFAMTVQLIMHPDESATKSQESQ